MNKQLKIDKLIKEDVARCRELCQYMEDVNATMPKGSLVLRNKKYYHAYREGGKLYRKLIENPHLQEQLKIKHFIKKGLPILKKRIAAGIAFLNTRQIYDPIEMAACFSTAYKDVNLGKFFLTGDMNPDKWVPQNFERNTIGFKEEHYTAKQVQVRSKSESMIGTQLEARNWLYICEPKLNFGEKIKCPDFAVMLPKTRKIVYIEHFGKMGEYSYVVETMNKLVLYSKHGLRLGVNFFFTWESHLKPLNELEIAEMLDRMEALDAA